jgi:hypothetical protein
LLILLASASILFTLERSLFGFGNWVTTLGGLIVFMWDTQEISPQVIVSWRSSLHMRHDMESCDQGGKDQDEAWLDGPVASVKSKSEALERWTVGRWSLSKTWHRWTDAMVKSKWSQDQWDNKVTWWYEVDHIICDMVGACVASTSEEMEWNAGISISPVIGV